MMSAATRVALYLRSSKDRHDLSLDAQRRALHEHAAAAGLLVAAEYADAVESGKDADRPGFQQLLGALKHADRGWDAVLALDTSRIARRRHLSLIFEHEAEKAGVAVLYRSVPDTDPITGMLLRSILQAMDEWHSLTSKAKGLAGMAESVRQGWRAGGAAPRGYQLEHQPTGILRDGAPVIRSRLTPGPDAEAVGAYLRARAQGKPRGLAARVSGLSGTSSGFNDLEWRALTYAGHTVWNQHAERDGGAYVGGAKRRPRDQWMITRDTHPALISDAEAEAVLAQLSARSGRRNRAGDRVYLLSGLMVAPDGAPWSGEWSSGAAAYRLGRGVRVSAKAIEGAILDAIWSDLGSPTVAAHIAELMRAQAAPADRPRDLARLRSRIGTLTRKIARLVDLVAEDPDAAPAYRRAIGQMEGERAALEEDLAEAAAASQQAEIVRLWTPSDVTRLLATLRESIEIDRDQGRTRDLRATLAALVERIEYDPATRTGTIRYRLESGVKVALPRGRTLAPVTWARVVSVPRRWVGAAL